MNTEHLTPNDADATDAHASATDLYTYYLAAFMHTRSKNGLPLYLGADFAVEKRQVGVLVAMALGTDDGTDGSLKTRIQFNEAFANHNRTADERETEERARRAVEKKVIAKTWDLLKQKLRVASEYWHKDLSPRDISKAFETSLEELGLEPDDVTG